MPKSNHVVAPGSATTWNGCLNRITWTCKGIHITARRRTEVGLDFFFFQVTPGMTPKAKHDADLIRSVTRKGRVSPWREDITSVPRQRSRPIAPLTGAPPARRNRSRFVYLPFPHFHDFIWYSLHRQPALGTQVWWVAVQILLLITPHRSNPSSSPAPESGTESVGGVWEHLSQVNSRGGGNGAPGCSVRWENDTGKWFLVFSVCRWSKMATIWVG